MEMSDDAVLAEILKIGQNVASLQTSTRSFEIKIEDNLRKFEENLMNKIENNKLQNDDSLERHRCADTEKYDKLFGSIRALENIVKQIDERVHIIEDKPAKTVLSGIKKLGSELYNKIIAIVVIIILAFFGFNVIDKINIQPPKNDTATSATIKASPR